MLQKTTTLYVSDSQSNSTVTPGLQREVSRLAAPKTASLRAFIPTLTWPERTWSRISRGVRHRRG